MGSSHSESDEEDRPPPKPPDINPLPSSNQSDVSKAKSFQHMAETENEQAAKAWVAKTLYEEDLEYEDEDSLGPMASMMDEKMHTYEYIAEQLINDDVYPNVYAMETQINTEEYMGTVVRNNQMTRVSGIDSNRTIFKTDAGNNNEGDLADTGANVNVTNDPSQLIQIVPIKPFALALAEEKDASSTSMCTHRGLYPLVDERTGAVEYTPMYLNLAATGTIVSPSAVLRHSSVYSTCTQTLHSDNRPGTLRFESASGFASLRISLLKKHGLYYLPAPKFRVLEDFTPSTPIVVRDEEEEVNHQPTAEKIRRTANQPVTPKQQVESELWAARLGNCSENQLDLLPNAVDGIPKQFWYHPFRYIDWKEEARVRKQPSRKIAERVSKTGHAFYMDLAFMRASSKHFTKSNKKDDRIIKSFDGFNAHLLVVDEASSRSWVFLLKSKEPPIEFVKTFLKTHGSKIGGLVRTDRGGELARSDSFKEQLFQDCQFTVESTGADSQSQNGGAERMNDTLAVMTRSLLYGADLPPQYWSVALLHSCYLYNRQVHSRLGKTPYEAWYGRKPNLRYLKVFGARVCVKKTGGRPAKLDKHSFSGIFLGFSATDQNIVYLDLISGIVKTSHHATFDEAWYLFDKRPPFAQLLYSLGQTLDVDSEKELTAKMMMTGQKLPYPPLPNNKLPSPKSVEAVMNIPLPLRWERTPTRNSIGAKAASTDGSCYEGTILDPSIYKKLFKEYDISKRDVLQIYISSDPYADEFTRTIDLKGFKPTLHKMAGLKLVVKNKRLILHHIQPSTPAAKIARWRSEMRGAWLKSVNGQPVETIQQVQEILDQMHRDKAKTCELTLSHPEVKPALSENGVPQCNLDMMNHRRELLGPAVLPPIIKQASAPPLYDYDGEVFTDGLPSAHKLTRGKLLKQDDWDEWEKSEFQQLDQYEAQGMFGDVVKLSEVVRLAEEKYGPATANNKRPLGVFHLVWTYAQKLAGDVKVRRKARAALDGSPRAGQAEIIGPTFANCADQTASRLFYAIAAAENQLLFGGDVSNAFAEAPGPSTLCYIKPDKAFQNWWTKHKKRPPLQDDEVIKICKAFQGHPEAGRAWSKHSDKILRQIGFTPTTHEPSLYSGIIDNERVLILRQVDDFAIAAPEERIAHIIFDKIDDHLTFPIKRLGLLKLFNGVDIEQTSEYIKISVESYITKIMEKHLQNWMTDPDEYPLANKATPLPTKKRFIDSFLTAEGNRLEDGKPDLTYQKQMEKELKISYRSGIGEIIWAMTTCRPDISHAAVKCSQFSSCPHKIHYHGVRHMLKYLNQTKSDGIYYWRATPREDLPTKERPVINSSINDLLIEKRKEFGPMEINAKADSDWANCPRTRRSYTGICVSMAGGTIAYKSRLQEVVALSSTEAELMAANEAGKIILYIRSILWDLGIPQMAATVIGEDNDACTAIGNAQKTTPRTRHLDIRYRALADWIERDLLILERVDTSVNTADHLTKLLARTLFHRHNDYLLGHVPPQYTQAYRELFLPQTKITTKNLHNIMEQKHHPKDDVGDKQINSLLAKWDLLCHLVER